DGLLDRLKFVINGNKYQVYGKPIPNALITDDIKNSKAYKMFFKYSTGLVPPKKSRGKAVKEDLPEEPTKSKQKPSKVTHATNELDAPKKVTASSKKKLTMRKLMLSDETNISKKELECRPLSSKKKVLKDVVIQEPPSAPIKKTYDSSRKLKDIKILSHVAQFEIDTLEAQKASRHKSRLKPYAGGSNEGTGSKPGVPNEITGKSTISDEEAGIQSEVPD
ncbi:hypothetical protein Tco_0171756, partial [Tanacetum coccineum]